MEKILQVRDLETQFETRNGTVHAVNGVSFDLEKGETLGIVGESGCGKSVTMTSILRLLPMPPGKVVAGSALFDGKDLLRVSNEEMRNIRGKEISFVFQDPMTSFNPVMTIGDQVAEPYRIHTGAGKAEAKARAAEYLKLVGIPNPELRLSDYPHQFSGGMRQRVMIAMGLICEPQILIADEPTTALDVTIQAQIVELVKTLQDKLGMSIIWITHDLGVIAGLADRMAVMYGGYIIEVAPVAELYREPRHPYTVGLLGSLPKPGDTGRSRLTSIEGFPPVLYQKPTFCPFADRCSYAMECCRCENPALRTLGGSGHQVACWVDIHNGKEF